MSDEEYETYLTTRYSRVFADRRRILLLKSVSGYAHGFRMTEVVGHQGEIEFLGLRSRE